MSSVPSRGFHHLQVEIFLVHCKPPEETLMQRLLSSCNHESVSIAVFVSLCQRLPSLNCKIVHITWSMKMPANENQLIFGCIPTMEDGSVRGQVRARSCRLVDCIVRLVCSSKLAFVTGSCHIRIPHRTRTRLGYLQDESEWRSDMNNAYSRHHSTTTLASLLSAPSGSTEY
jgi:hypothetical protein